MDETITYTMDEMCDRIASVYKLGHDDGFADGRNQRGDETDETHVYTTAEINELIENSYHLGYEDGYDAGRDQVSEDVTDELME